MFCTLILLLMYIISEVMLVLSIKLTSYQYNYYLYTGRLYIHNKYVDLIFSIKY